MHEKISDVTVLTIIISTVLLVVLGTIIIIFLFAYQKKIHRHHEELLVLNENFEKTLLLSKLAMQEQTLDHIAKELHSNISQVVSVINMNLSTFLRENKDGENNNIVETKGLVKQLMAEIKNLSFTLNTEHIGRAGFQRMIKGELDRLDKTGIYAIEFSTEGTEYRLGPEKEIILFRLCQELINNVIKHAEADTIAVKLCYGESSFSVQISDNGKGFDPVEVAKNEGKNNSTGMANAHDRTKQIDGTLSVESSIGKGTAITVTIPIL